MGTSKGSVTFVSTLTWTTSHRSPFRSTKEPCSGTDLSPSMSRSISSVVGSASYRKTICLAVLMLSIGGEGKTNHARYFPFSLHELEYPVQIGTALQKRSRQNSKKGARHAYLNDKFRILGMCWHRSHRPVVRCFRAKRAAVPGFVGQRAAGVDGTFRLLARRPVAKIPPPAIRILCQGFPHRIGSMLFLRYRRLSPVTNNCFGRHIAYCLNAEKNSPESSQGNSIYLSYQQRMRLRLDPGVQAVTALPLKKCRRSITIPTMSRM